MWIPKTEQDIEVAASNRSLSETVTFDAKKEIPTKNTETAKDVSALANTAGGVLLYGVDEDPSGCPCVLSPISLAGQRERIEQIIRTSVDEVPQFKLFAIETEIEPNLGYVVVVVPPSERAPHMVIVKGERRFYGRGETGNYILSQIEISRLYERRQLASGSSGIKTFLEGFVSAPPIPANQEFAHLHVAAKPVLNDDAMLTHALGPGEHANEMLTSLILQVRDDSKVYGRGYEPDFNPPISGWTRYPEGYFCKMSEAHGANPQPDPFTLQLRVNLDGSAYLFSGRAAETAQSEKCFLESVVEGSTSRFLAMLGLIFEKASYFGMVDVGLAITRVQGCVNYEHRIQRSRPRRYDGPDYKKFSRTSATRLGEEPRAVAAQLLTAIFEALR